MKEIRQDEMKELLKEYEENPFDTSSKSPADIMRIFFQNNTSIVPVVSRRNILLGIITRENITSEMSDIARFTGVPIDRFVTRVARKMNFDEVLPFVVDSREFTVVNLFGEVVGTWTRLQLLASCDGQLLGKKDVEAEVESQRAEQQIQWMVYHVLEHIPRPLYAVNESGKTVFYNSYFEEMYFEKTGKDEVDVSHVEKTLVNMKVNDFKYLDESHDEMYFVNSDLGVAYEKIPMKGSSGELSGYLYYFGRDINRGKKAPASVPGNLAKIVEEAEAQAIVQALSVSAGDELQARKLLGLAKSAMDSKMKKYGIAPHNKKS